METRITLRNEGKNELDYLFADDAQNAYQEITLNQKSVLVFEMRRDNFKSRYFDWADTTAEVNGRVYCLWGDNGQEDTLDDRSKDENDTLLKITMKEIWYKLNRRYVTAYNLTVPSSEFDHIDTHMVVLLGNSSDPLYINGQRVTAPYPVGSAKYMFWCLLHGTGWTLDERYDAYWPDGEFDLETDKKDILENIKTLVGLYGGFLMWDSVNMRVALVDEEKYQAHNGCQRRSEFAFLWRLNFVGLWHW